MVGLVWFITIISNVLFFAILVRFLMSFIDPQQNNVISRFCYELTEPVLAPIRKIVPPVGGMLDLSPMILLLLLQMLQMLVIRL